MNILRMYAVLFVVIFLLAILFLTIMCSTWGQTFIACKIVHTWGHCSTSICPKNFESLANNFMGRITKSNFLMLYYAYKLTYRMTGHYHYLV